MMICLNTAEIFLGKKPKQDWVLQEWLREKKGGRINSVFPTTQVEGKEKWPMLTCHHWDMKNPVTGHSWALCNIILLT